MFSVNYVSVNKANTISCILTSNRTFNAKIFLKYSGNKSLKQSRCLFPGLFNFPKFYSVVFYLSANYE